MLSYVVLQKFLYTPFPVESCLQGRLCENLNAEIVSGTCRTLIECVGYLTWTFFARRVKANPSYYGATSSSDEDVESFLLSVTKETLTLLENESCIALDGDMEDVDCDILPSSLGTASSAFYLAYRTPKQIQVGLRECARMMSESTEFSDPSNAVLSEKESRPIYRTRREDEMSIAWLLYTIATTHEFDELPVRHNEEDLNMELSNRLMWGPDTSKLLSSDGRSRNVDREVFASSHTK